MFYSTAGKTFSPIFTLMVHVHRTDNKIIIKNKSNISASNILILTILPFSGNSFDCSFYAGFLSHFDLNVYGHIMVTLSLASNVAHDWSHSLPTLAKKYKY